MLETFAYVTAEGVSRGEANDASYRRLLDECLKDIARRRVPVKMILAGGATDPSKPHLTEAAELNRILGDLLHTHDAKPFVSWVSRFGDFNKARKNMHHLALTVEQTRQMGGQVPEVYIYCDYAQQDWMRILAWHFLRHAHVVPIHASRRPIVSRFARWPHTITKAVGFYVGLAHHKLTFRPPAHHYTRRPPSDP